MQYFSDTIVFAVGDCRLVVSFELSEPKREAYTTLFSEEGQTPEGQWVFVCAPPGKFRSIFCDLVDSLVDYLAYPGGFLADLLADPDDFLYAPH